MNPWSLLCSVLMLPVIGGLFLLLAANSKFSERGVGAVLPLPPQGSAAFCPRLASRVLTLEASDS